MATRTEVMDRSPATLLVAALLSLGLFRVAARLGAFAALLGVVFACVGALTIGVVILRLLLLR
ncbi:hypothetical protein [Amnibacterium kyonggiense]|uniref:Uncharacterized protein n=1 Tax=Amnibacterium kyonggiense TaxID=595671 RepID=A0A4R7FTH3_9MICO|nr:hypothetical protein [Amnibacterium kyonggiense]TDS81098.1 hypothetical protein CLV52_1673 [Amnibacterium kyonggiense]